MRKFGFVLFAGAALLGARVVAEELAPETAARYLQCRNGEIQLLPALDPDEME